MESLLGDNACIDPNAAAPANVDGAEGSDEETQSTGNVDVESTASLESEETQTPLPTQSSVVDAGMKSTAIPAATVVDDAANADDVEPKEGLNLFCDDCHWLGGPYTCSYRVKYLVEHYEMTEKGVSSVRVCMYTFFSKL